MRLPAPAAEPAVPVSAVRAAGDRLVPHGLLRPTATARRLAAAGRPRACRSNRAAGRNNRACPSPECRNNRACRSRACRNSRKISGLGNPAWACPHKAAGLSNRACGPACRSSPACRRPRAVGPASRGLRNSPAPWGGQPGMPMQPPAQGGWPQQPGMPQRPGCPATGHAAGAGRLARPAGPDAAAAAESVGRSAGHAPATTAGHALSRRYAAAGHAATGYGRIPAAPRHAPATAAAGRSPAAATAAATPAATGRPNRRRSSPSKAGSRLRRRNRPRAAQPQRPGPPPQGGARRGPRSRPVRVRGAQATGRARSTAGRSRPVNVPRRPKAGRRRNRPRRPASGPPHRRGRVRRPRPPSAGSRRRRAGRKRPAPNRRVRRPPPSPCSGSACREAAPGRRAEAGRTGPPWCGPSNSSGPIPRNRPADAQATPLRNAPAVDSQGRIFHHFADRLVGLVEEDGKPKLLWEYVTGHPRPARSSSVRRTRCGCIAATAACTASTRPTASRSGRRPTSASRWATPFRWSTPRATPTSARPTAA